MCLSLGIDCPSDPTMPVKSVGHLGGFPGNSFKGEIIHAVSVAVFGALV